MVNLAFVAVAPPRRAPSVQRRGPRQREPADRLVRRLRAISTEQPSATEWRRVRGRPGTYLPEHQFLVVNRSQNGETGTQRRRRAAAQRRHAAARQPRVRRPERRRPCRTKRHREVIGRVRESERRRTGQQSDAGSDVLTDIRRVDIDVLRQQFDQNVLPMYVEQLESTPADAASLAADRGTDARRRPAPVVHGPVVHLQPVRDRRLGVGGSPLGGEPVGQTGEEAEVGLHPDRRRPVSAADAAPCARARPSA